MSKERRAEARLALVLAIGFSLLVLSVAACQPADSAKTPLATAPAPTVTVPVDLPVTIALAGSFAYPVLQVLDRQVAAFEATNPDLRVEVVRAPRAEDRRRAWVIESLSSGNSSIDLYALEATWAAELAARGWLLPLDDYLDSADSGAAAFLPGAVEANTLDGQVVALPWSADASLLYYRRDLLDGLRLEPPASWAEVPKMALAAKRMEGLPYGYLWPGVAGDTLTCVTLEWIGSVDPKALAGGLRTAFDQPAAQLALQQMSGLVASEASPADVTTLDEQKVLNAFRAGEAVFIRGGLSDWDYVNSQDSAVAGEVGIAALPGSCLAGKALALSAHSQRPDKAWRFLAFMLDHEQQVQMALAAGQPPAYEAAYRDPTIVETMPELEALHRALSSAYTRPADPTYAAVSAAIAEEVNRMLAGDQDAETAAAAIQRRLAEIPSR